MEFDYQILLLDVTRLLEEAATNDVAGGSLILQNCIPLCICYKVSVVAGRRIVVGESVQVSTDHLDDVPCVFVVFDRPRRPSTSVPSPSLRFSWHPKGRILHRGRLKNVGWSRLHYNVLADAVESTENSLLVHRSMFTCAPRVV